MTTLWRYSVPSKNGEGWAIFVLGSDGFFSVVSDFGNYAFLWTDPGVKDFREFFLNIDRKKGYFIRKLSNGQLDYDNEKTQAFVTQALSKLTEAERVYNEELIEDTYNNLYSEQDFLGWANATSTFELIEARQFACYRAPHMVTRLVTEAMVSLETLIQKELQDELVKAFAAFLVEGMPGLEEIRAQANQERVDFYTLVAAKLTGRSSYLIQAAERALIKKALFGATYGLDPNKPQTRS